MNIKQLRINVLLLATILLPVPTALATYWSKCAIFTNDAGLLNYCTRTEEGLCQGKCTNTSYSVSPVGNCVSASMFNSCSAIGSFITVITVLEVDCIATGGYVSGSGCDCGSEWVLQGMNNVVYNCM